MLFVYRTYGQYGLNLSTRSWLPNAAWLVISISHPSKVGSPMVGALLAALGLCRCAPTSSTRHWLGWTAIRHASMVSIRRMTFTHGNVLTAKMSEKSNRQCGDGDDWHGVAFSCAPTHAHGKSIFMSCPK